MAVVSNAGYQDIRDYIQETWKYVELKDSSGTAIFRRQVDNDKVKWTHTSGAQTLELTVVINGSDADITLPKTFASASLYKVASGGTPFTADSFTAFTMESTTDKLTITYKIEVPEVV